MERKPVSVNGINLSVQVSGNPDGPTLLLLHGWPESARAWSGLVPLLELEYRLVIPDQRGFGASDRPEGTAAYSMTTLAADAVELLDWAGADTAGIVAHDFGGAVAWALGALVPERISRMVILASPHPMRLRQAGIENPDQIRRAFYVWLLHSPSGRSLLAADGFERLAAWAFGGTDSVSWTERRAYIEEWSAPGAFEAMAQWYRANYRPELFDPGVPLELAPVTVPVRYIHPERDPAFVSELASGSGDWVDAEYDELVLAGTSHWLVHERPGEVARLVREWMAQGERAE